MPGRAAGRWGVGRVAWPVVCFEGSDGVPHSFLGIPNGLGPQLLDRNEHPDPVSNLLDAHFLQDQLVTLDKITAGNVVTYTGRQLHAIEIQEVESILLKRCSYWLQLMLRSHSPTRLSSQDLWRWRH